MSSRASGDGGSTANNVASPETAPGDFAISFLTIVTFLTSIALQVFALSMLPVTAGFTRLGPTLLVIAAFTVGIGLFARVSASGVPMSMILPISSALLPIAVIAISVIFQGEQASPMRLALLIGACILIGIAGSIR